MIEPASVRLHRLNDKIMNLWEERACEEVKAASQHTSLALQNSLPEFLGLMENALSTTINRTKARVKWDLSENTRVGQKHGRERSKMLNYTMDQLIFEYHILRQVVCEVMEEEAPLSTEEREIIVCAVEQAVNDAATEFSEALRDIQEKFTQTLAHDLRNPITSAKLSAQLIIKKPDDVSSNVKVAHRICATMDRLDSMIHDLLDAGKLRTGEILKLDFAECDLDQILKQVTEESNLLQGDRIVYNSIGDLKGNWNELGLRRIVENLVSNAIKFSEPYSIITISVKASSEHVSVSVHNVGKPIPESEIPILFDQYKRASSAEGKKGWGLGLAVVRGLMQAHGGDVGVESNTKVGTVFTFTLPKA